MIQQNKILDIAAQLFSASGIRNVTMDVIAKHLSVSKKTIYKLFRDKNGLVTAMMLRKVDRWKEQISEIINRKYNVIVLMIKLADYSHDTFLNFNGVIIEDMKKYYAEAWSLYQNFKTVFVIDIIESLLAKGKARGYFRPDLDEGIISRMWLRQLEMTVDLEIYPTEKFSRTKVKEELLNLCYIGIILK